MSEANVKINFQIGDRGQVSAVKAITAGQR
jgi:hypothetical protein